MNNLKRVLALLLVLCLGLCLVACGGNQAEGGKDAETTGTTQGTEPTGTTQSTEPTGTTQSTEPTETEPTDDGKVDYLVTVVYPDGTPVAGAYVQICKDDICYTPVATDENGVATFRLPKQEGYKTKLAMAVDGYVWADYIYFEEGATEITIQLVAESDGKVDYTVTVVYPDGTPVVGAYVQICMEDICYTPVATDENGIATFRLAEQEGYKTKLAMAVDGYVWADYIYFESGATEITITLVPAE